MTFIKTLSAISAGFLIMGAASAQEYYVGGSIGLLIQDDSSNSGSTGEFTTGNLGDGTTLDVAAGTPYGWSTEFDNGTSFSAEVGARYASGLRSGIELVSNSADVDTHTGVTLGGGDIGGLDAASIAGSADTLGVTVADVVADGRGDIETTAIFVNAYYDFNRTSSVQPYIGAGLGYADVSVSYVPSGITVISDSEAKFAYQIKAGATYKLPNQWELFGEYTYRATEDLEFDNQLFPGTLNIENKQSVFSVGARYSFGS